MTADHQAAHRLGYHLHQPVGESTPALFQLDVVLRDEPTREHFDPEELCLTVADAAEVADREITHRPHTAATLRAAAGRVVLRDRLDETVAFFTFGGDLHVRPEDTLTFCTLTSPAPIIPLYHETSVVSLLGVEGEVMLARRRAVWGTNRATYEARLAQVDPLLLYAALLEHLEAHFDCFPPDVREGIVQDFINYLYSSLSKLRRSSGWPSVVPSIGDLL